MTGEQFARGPDWTLARAMSAVNDGQLSLPCIIPRRNGRPKPTAAPPAILTASVTPIRFQIPGGSWRHERRWRRVSSGATADLQDDAFREYHFHKHFPQIFGADPLFTVLNFVLGCHPATNESFVTGVGLNSAPVANGFNCADWSYIPGGIFSGCSLIQPDFMELKVFPFLWYQREYVIGGAATYIFLAGGQQAAEFVRGRTEGVSAATDSRFIISDSIVKYPIERASVLQGANLCHRTPQDEG